MSSYDPRSEILEKLPEGEWIVEFDDDSTVVMGYFDLVDHSIYDRGDMLLSHALKVIHHEGVKDYSDTLVEYTVDQIVRVQEKKSGRIVYEIEPGI